MKLDSELQHSFDSFFSTTALPAPVTNRQRKLPVSKERCLDISDWQLLYDRLKFQNDVISMESLAVVLRGLKTIQGKEYGDEEGRLILAPMRPVLTRLVTDYNNPRLFIELGKIYLQDFGLPSTAKEHFERSGHLGSEDDDLVLLEHAVEEMLAQEALVPRTPTGVEAPRYGQKIKTLIRQTSRIPLLSRQEASIQSPLDLSDGVQILKSCVESVQAVRSAMSNGRHGYAGRILAEVSTAEIDPELLWELWTDLGLAHFQANQFEESEKAYCAAKDLFPVRLISQFNWGIALQMNLKFESAMAAYSEADWIEPDNPKVWCNKGSLFFLQDNFLESEAALRHAVELKPDYARAWDNLASTLGAQGKLEEAEMACQTAIRIAGVCPAASFKLGIIFFTQCRYGEAIISLSAQGLTLELTAFATAYISMSWARLGNTKASEEALRLAEQLGANIEILGTAWTCLGRCYFDKMDFSRAKSACEKACELNPRDSQTWMQLGLAHQFNHNFGPASVCFRHSLELEAIPVAA